VPSKRKTKIREDEFIREYGWFAISEHIRKEPQVTRLKIFVESQIEKTILEKA